MGQLARTSAEAPPRREKSGPRLRSALLSLTFAGVSLLVGGLRPEESSAARNSLAFPCNCYVDSDCSSDNSAVCTGYGGCSEDGKLDGRCIITVLRVTPIDLVGVEQAMRLYFDAYLAPVEATEGRPDAGLLEEALRIPLPPAQQRTETDIQDAVHDALDAVIGFDFSPPRSMGSTNPGDSVRPPLPLLFGNIRGAHHEGSEAIVEAARDGMCQAILSRNLNAIEPPLEAFWAAHPDFHPAHTGRLYPHGHPEYEDAVGTPIAGQIDALKRIVFGLLNDGLPLCGNDVREGEEECDGGDAATCASGFCDPDCSCGFIPD